MDKNSVQSDQHAEKDAEQSRLLAEAAEKNRPFLANWQADKDSCQAQFPTFEAYAAYQRHLANQSE